MHIAIIEDDESYLDLLKKSINEFNWEIDFFRNSKEFGKSDLKSYDVVVSDFELPTISGRDLINSIADKTSAQFFLMGNNFSEEDVENENIVGLIEKDDPSIIVDQLKYTDAKLRINKCIEVENGKYKDLIENNGYRLEIKDGIIMIGISNVLSEKSKERIMREIEKTNLYKGVVFFPEKNSVPSEFLGELAYFYNYFKLRKGKIVFWNVTSSDLLAEQVRMCCLDKLFPIFNRLEDAIKFLKKV